MVSIRPPPFGRGKRILNNRGASIISFQSAPRLSEGGNSIRTSLSPTDQSFNPPPAFRKGETLCVLGRVFGNVLFQSAPRLSEGGNVALLVVCRCLPSFNPPPAFRKGETRKSRSIVARLTCFNPPPAFRKGETSWVASGCGRSGFQSAPRLSEGGNDFRSVESINLTEVSIRPPPFGRGKRAGWNVGDSASRVSIRPPPFGRGKRHHNHWRGTLRNVSIRPPPFGRGKPTLAEVNATTAGFQSAPRLSEGGN